MRPTPRRSSATTEGGAARGSYSPAPPASQDKTSPAHGQESEGNRAGQDRPPGLTARRPTPEVGADQPETIGDSGTGRSGAGAGGRTGSFSTFSTLVTGRTRPVRRGVRDG